MSETLGLTAYDRQLIQASIVSSFGVELGIDYMIDEINIYEDIFSNVISGDMRLIDSNNTLSRLQLHGHEFFLLNFKSPNFNEYQKSFRIYKVSDVEMKTQSSLEYVVHFCSEEFFLNQQKRISKSYKGMMNSDIIKDIAYNQLQISTSKMKSSNIEQTYGIQNIIVPYLKPLEAINWIASYSLNASLSSSFLFFENKDGFHFKSLDNLFKGNIRKKIFISNKNSLAEYDSSAQQFFVDNFQFPQLFNSLDLVSNGGYSSGMYKINLRKQTVEQVRFNPIQNKFKTLNEHLPFNLARNRFEETPIKKSAYFRYFPTFQNNIDDKWLLQRANQFALLNSCRLNIELPGDSDLRVGDMLEFSFPDITPRTSSAEIQEDSRISGLYLIANIRHRIFKDKYICYLQICKDSVKENFDLFKENPKYNSAKKS